MNGILKDDNYWMTQAIELAKRAADSGEVPVGALIVKDNVLIAEAWYHPICLHDATAHAGLLAIRAARDKLHNFQIPDTTLYVTIEPCAMCLGAIVHARIGRVVFGSVEPKAGMLTSNRAYIESGCFNHTFEWLGGVEADLCAEIMSNFFKNRRAAKKAERSK